ncbi:fimbria/pilus periplasmic chaperone [Serratia marcescens]|uniref:fimbria/pilus periplasmic chaperone n=1 Tax=Serratia quinivorans TaxID=137545 RepID=UPI000D934008|nr:fimbria/pilus periplasmic chaperone [Serratia quinivorans]SPZ65778.1 Chaperone protein papD precursor [Serratia quinivorans]VEI74039.1 Chaperone protein papD precursor [Serratia quinivorans]
MKMNKILPLSALLLCTGMTAQQANAAISLDRTRIVFNGGEKSQSLTVSNQNKQLPYLAQGWIEDTQGNKIQTPLTILPPVQRIEPGAQSQIKIQALPGANLLAQDRESLFYFNLREIPPKSDKPNTLQIALQTRIKLFYRPASIVPTKTQMAAPWQEKLTLTRQGDSYQLNNPTPYFITLVDAGSKPNADGVKGFEPVMVPPKGQAPLGVNAGVLGANPVLTYINDYGGRPQLKFTCSGTTCSATPVKDSK